MPQNYIKAAKILGTKGLEGELKIDILLSDKKHIKQDSILFLDDYKNSLTVENIKYANNKYDIIRFKEIKDIDTAKKYSNTELYMKTENFDHLSNNEFYLYELIQFSIYVNDKFLGKISTIENYGSKDVINIVANQANYSVPIVNGLIKKVDKQLERIEFDEKIYSEVVFKNEN